MEPSPGSPQLNAIEASPATPDNPDGAAPGGDAAVVDADTSLTAPAPEAFKARTCIRYDAPRGSFGTR